MGPQFFHNEARIRLKFGDAPIAFFAVAKLDASTLAPGITVRVREATRHGTVQPVRIIKADTDEQGPFFHASPA